MVCPPVCRHNPRALAYISVDLAYYQIFYTKVSKGGIKIIVTGQESLHGFTVFTLSECAVAYHCFYKELYIEVCCYKIHDGITT